MRNKFFILTSILTSSMLFAACGGAANETNNASANKDSANANVVNSTSNAVVTSKTPEAPTTDNAPTLTPVVNSYYEALKKKDDAGLRKVLSTQTLKDVEDEMKTEKKTKLAEFIAELEPAPEKAFEVRNEKITGDRAVAEIKGGNYVNWTPLTFVKENGEWKMTNESPDFDDVKKSAANSNTAR